MCQHPQPFSAPPTITTAITILHHHHHPPPCPFSHPLRHQPALAPNPTTAALFHKRAGMVHHRLPALPCPSSSTQARSLCDGISHETPKIQTGKPSHQKRPSCTTFNPSPNACAIHNAPQKTVLFHVITSNLSSAFASTTTTTSTSYPGCIVYFSVSRHVIGTRRVGRHDATPVVQHLRSHLEAANAAIATFDSQPVAHLLSSPRRQYHGSRSVLDANVTHRSITVWLPSRSSSALPMQTTSARPTC